MYDRLKRVKPSHLVVETYDSRPNASGGFGYHMPRGIKITHTPTGLSVSEDDQRSPHKNKIVALEKLDQLLIERETKTMSEIVSNTTHDNGHIAETITDITEWHYARNLIHGATDISQFDKLIEEMMELRMSIEPGIDAETAKQRVTEAMQRVVDRDKLKPAKDRSNLRDDIGDINVVLINIAERNFITYADCLDQAYWDIKDRKGKMIDGVFVKEADL